MFVGDTTGKVWEFDVGKTDLENTRDTPWNMTIQIPFSRVSDPAQLGWGQITRLGLEWVSQLRPEVQCFYDNRDAIAHQIKAGVDLAYTGVQIEEVGLDDQKGLGHWVSVKMIIENASFENEVHQIHTHVNPRGHRTRRRIRLAEY